MELFTKAPTDRRLGRSLEAHCSLEGWVGSERRVMLAAGLICMLYFSVCLRF